ncbi:MAG: lysophospholipase [Methylobacter sp.]|uniref:esterase/lipase family protein n=1 Tax=Methylobacter sp. TaxID=2051955 RepID=UPI0025D12CAF|nr:alpha/beta fold hydrolase [Methylobacter sp.]MCK9620338.1 lysophospholipase [Methylobacter sp.]
MKRVKKITARPGIDIGLQSSEVLAVVMASAASLLKRLHFNVTIIEIVLVSGLALIVSGCANPVGVKNVDIQTGYRLQTESVLSVGQPSDASQKVLRRNGLLDRFEAEPSRVLAELHAALKPTGDDDRLFALAELSFLHAERTGDRAYFLASAVYAWALLLPGDDNEVLLKPSDPRFRLAYDLYNQGVAQGLAAPGDEDDHEVRLEPGEYKLPFGTLQVTLDKSGLTWGGYRLDHFISTSTLAVHGLRNRYRNPGLGASLTASLAARQKGEKVIGSERLGPRTQVPVTALLRFEHARANLAGGKLSGRLELYASDQAETVAVDDGRLQPIEFDPTAALAYQLNDSPLYSMEISAFFRGGFISGLMSDLKSEDRTQDGLFTLQPHRAGKIPVVLVHGTASSPARWAELINELQGDPIIRKRFQIWVFLYDSGNPIGYSAGLLRTALTNAVQEFDPEGKDTTLQRMVVIGHSQGGLLTKLTAIDSGTRLWDRVSNKPLDEVLVNPEIRTLLRRSMFFKPLPFVERVVFISTPHHGAMLAARRVITGLAAKLISLPRAVLGELAQAAGTISDEKLAAAMSSPPTAVDNMSPNNPALKILETIPVMPRIKAHSIIAVEGDGPKEEGDDGVVTYRSAHIDEAVSELVVRWSHSSQGQPEVIEEIRRILNEHLATFYKKD